MLEQPRGPIRAGFVEIRDPHTGKLLCRYDPNRDLLELRQRGVKTIIDLSEYRVPIPPNRGNGG